jgi:hypothetical protein
MKTLLVTTNKIETILNIVFFAIGSALIVICITCLIYGIKIGLL